MQIDFRYSHIRLEQFATKNGTSNQRPFVFHTSGGIQTGFNYEARTVIMTVSANIKVEDQSIMTIKVSSFFEISTESWENLKEDGFVVVPQDFLFHVGGLAVSTARGILYAKTEGTDLSTYILPLVNMNQVIHSDLKIPIQE